MGALVREVAEDVDQPIAQRLAQPQHHAPQPLAVGTQQIGVPHDDHGVGRAPAARVVSGRIEGPSQSHRR